MLITLLISYSSYPQENSKPLQLKDKSDLVFDSLVTSLSEASTDTLRINILNDIAWHFAPTNFEESIKFADSALALSRKIKWKKGEGYSLKHRGEAYRYRGEIQKALLNHETALSIFQKIDNAKGVASLLSNIGIAHYMMSNFPKAFDYYTQALELGRKNEDDNGILKNLSLIGVLYYTFGRYSEALVYYEKALDFASQLNNEIDMAAQFTNIGLTQLQLTNYLEAIEEFEAALKIYERQNDLYNYAIVNGNLGTAYYKTKQFDKALLKFQSTLKLSKQMGDNYGIAHQLANIGLLKLEIHQHSKATNTKRTNDGLLAEAEDYFLQAIKEFDSSGLLDEKAYYSSKLADVYKIQGNFEKALFYRDQEVVLKDSIFSVENNKRLADLEVKQNLALKELEIELLNKDNSYQKTIKQISISLVLLFILVSLIIYSLYKAKERQNLLLAENIQEREKAESSLRKHEVELERHKNNLEQLVRKRTEELENEIMERKLTEEDLLIAINRVESANKAKSVFLENMSHELRTPLVGILGYSSLLSSEVDSQDLKEMADGINRTGNRLLNTLSMILDLARIESDHFEINITEVDVENELNEIYENFKGAVASKNINFSLHLDDDTKRISTDSSMFKVIIENLVNNAIKFTKEGSIIIASRTEEIESKNYFFVDIIDSGIGIKKNEVLDIFKEFKQLSEGTVKAFQGTGLGLSISKKFTEYLNGELSVESEFGSGSKFTVKLPI